VSGSRDNEIRIFGKKTSQISLYDYRYDREFLELSFKYLNTTMGLDGLRLGRRALEEGKQQSKG
jgi:hypothetical protein